MPLKNNRDVEGSMTDNYKFYTFIMKLVQTCIIEINTVFTY